MEVGQVTAERWTWYGVSKNMLRVFVVVGRTDKERDNELQSCDNHLIPTVRIHRAVLGFLNEERLVRLVQS